MNEKTKTIFDPRYKFFIEQLVKVRKNLGISQRDLAKRWGTSHPYVARTEIRERRLDLIEAIDLLKALELSRKEILHLLGQLI
jgi:predicted transcriptional regulator